MSRFAPLLEHVATMAPERIYRTIYDEDFNPVVLGTEPMHREELEHFNRVAFQGKDVLDLGCNFGFFSFQARRLGAARVLGVDCDPDALAGARILQTIFGLQHITFDQVDFDARPNPLQGRQFDLVMLVEFIGKGYTRSGLIPTLLAFVETLTERELLLSLRRDYRIREELGLEPEQLAALYPSQYITGELFRILDYVRDFYAPRWKVEVLSPLYTGHEKSRKYLRFHRG